jgi:hypothetical protein
MADRRPQPQCTWNSAGSGAHDNDVGVLRLGGQRAWIERGGDDEFGGTSQHG